MAGDPVAIMRAAPWDSELAQDVDGLVVLLLVMMFTSVVFGVSCCCKYYITYICKSLWVPIKQKMWDTKLP